MSVIIKGMKLPLPGSVMVWALIDDKLQCSIVTRDKPIEWCEVLEIPTPHGRLINEDNLRRCIKEVLINSDVISVFEYIIERQPTIIEAEVSE